MGNWSARALGQAAEHSALIINQIRSRGMAAPLYSNDIIWLQQVGVSPQVIATMQETQPPPAVIVEQAPPPPVVVGGYYYGRVTFTF